MIDLQSLGSYIVILFLFYLVFNLITVWEVCKLFRVRHLVLSDFDSLSPQFFQEFSSFYFPAWLGIITKNDLQYCFFFKSQFFFVPMLQVPM